MASKVPIGIPSTGGWCNPPSQREADGKERAKLVCVSRRMSWVLFLHFFCFHIWKVLFSEVFPGSGGHLDFMVLQAHHGLLWWHHRSPAEVWARLLVQVCWSWSDIPFLGDVPLFDGSMQLTRCPVLSWPRCLCPSWDVSGTSRDLWQPWLVSKLGCGWTPADFI